MEQLDESIIRDIQAAEEELVMVGEEIDTTSQEYKDYTDPSSDEGKIGVEKILKKVVNLETGKLNRGYALITSDIANRRKIKVGNRVLANTIPSDSILSAGGVEVVGIMQPTLSEPGKVVLNSEDIQGVRGKDYDIDTIFIVSASEMLSQGSLDAMIESLEQSFEAHKKKMVKDYRKVLGTKEFVLDRYTKLDDEVGKWEEVTVKGSQLQFQDILKKEVRLAYTQEANGKNPEGKRLFNPNGEALTILNKYNKDIGKIVNRRKRFTIKSQLNFKTLITSDLLGEIYIDANHKDTWNTYMLLMNMTNDMVDMPTNENNFFYIYDELKAYDQDNGTYLYNLREMNKENEDYKEVKVGGTRISVGNQIGLNDEELKNINTDKKCSIFDEDSND